jgi:predicted permease
VCAGLLIRSLDRLKDVKPGFVAAGTLSFQVALPAETFPSFKERRAFTGAVLDRLRAVPGVTVAGASSALPLSGLPAIQNYAYDTESIRNWGDLSAERISVTRDYFSAAGIRIVAGESFSAAAAPNSAPVVIIDEDIARKAWPNENAVGKRIQVFRSGTIPDPFATIIGVAEHVRANDLRQRGRPQIYWSYEDRSPQAMYYVVRTTSNAERLAATVRQIVAEVNSSVPLTRVMPLGGYVSQALARPRFATVLMQIVGGFSLFLATIGLYGVIAFLVGQRTHEFGIRLAMGATPNRLRGWVVLRGARLVVASAIVGLALSSAITTMLRSMLYDVSPYDPLTFIGVCALIAGVAGIACYVPARQASKTSPLEALRAD